jgi:hypothetical protein
MAQDTRTPWRLDWMVQDQGPLGVLARWSMTGAPWKLKSHAQNRDVCIIYNEMLCCACFLIAFEAIYPQRHLIYHITRKRLNV